MTTRGGNVRDMIRRFRNDPPTSRADRDNARRNGRMPQYMWYSKRRVVDNDNDDDTTGDYSSVNNDARYLKLSRLLCDDDDDAKVMDDALSLLPAKKDDKNGGAVAYQRRSFRWSKNPITNHNNDDDSHVTTPKDNQPYMMSSSLRHNKHILEERNKNDDNKPRYRFRPTTTDVATSKENDDVDGCNNDVPSNNVRSIPKLSECVKHSIRPIMDRGDGLMDDSSVLGMVDDIFRVHKNKENDGGDVSSKTAAMISVRDEDEKPFCFGANGTHDFSFNNSEELKDDYSSLIGEEFANITNIPQISLRLDTSLQSFRQTWMEDELRRIEEEEMKNDAEEHVTLVSGPLSSLDDDNTTKKVATEESCHTSKENNNSHDSNESKKDTATVVVGGGNDDDNMEKMVVNDETDDIDESMEFDGSINPSSDAIVMELDLALEFMKKRLSNDGDDNDDERDPGANENAPNNSPNDVTITKPRDLQESNDTNCTPVSASCNVVDNGNSKNDFGENNDKDQHRPIQQQLQQPQEQQRQQSYNINNDRPEFQTSNTLIRLKARQREESSKWMSDSLQSIGERLLLNPRRRPFVMDSNGALPLPPTAVIERSHSWENDAREELEMFKGLRARHVSLLLGR